MGSCAPGDLGLGEHTPGHSEPQGLGGLAAAGVGLAPIWPPRRLGLCPSRVSFRQQLESKVPGQTQVWPRERVLEPAVTDALGPAGALMA